MEKKFTKYDLTLFLLKTLGKEKIARYEQFLFFPQCFLPFWRTFYHFHQILIKLSSANSFGLEESKICRLGGINSLPNDKFLDSSKLKAFADDKINVTEKLNFDLGSVENNVEKRRKCWLPAFSPFPTMFSKVFFPGGVVKSRDCVVNA